MEAMLAPLAVVSAFLKVAGVADFGVATSLDTLHALIISAATKMVGIDINFFIVVCFELY